MAYLDRYNGKGWLYAASNKGQEGLVNGVSLICIKGEENIG